MIDQSNRAGPSGAYSPDGTIELHDGWTTDDASTAWRSYLPQPVRTLFRRVLRTPSVRSSIARHNDYGHRNMQLLNVIILCTKCKCSAPVIPINNIPFLFVDVDGQRSQRKNGSLALTQ
ncbi:hypothetical protein WA026_019290 [Henosepilachna vigintioctopunctata]|uniref:Uncharacterized protein n=1 Tax=Henosepilachna vigintioctopunctata TaxID=420089 RepID=A0AAW1U9P8_9CUCU